tara:strand:- start:1422 stop:2027 length:606 start_codon:yes stop_codon:yes gene_type:complete
MSNRGFTLIEILVALTLFAILATLTSSFLYKALNTREHLNKQNDMLAQLERALIIIQQDLIQIIDTPLSSTNVSAHFLGDQQAIEFTRMHSAFIFPTSKFQALQKIKYYCTPHQLIRQTQSVYSDNNTIHKKIILDGLETCEFQFLNHLLAVQTQWQVIPYDEDSLEHALPIAVKLSFSTSSWGDFSRIWLIPLAFYDNVH